MATKLKGDLDRRQSTRHPWDKWSDGSAWRVKSGEDFEGSLLNFRSLLYVTAKRLGKRVTSTVVDDTTLDFQFRKA